MVLEKVYKGYKKGITPSNETGRAKRVSQVSRKAISLVAPKGSLVKAVTRQTKKKGDRGRGRPSGTYKVRYLPSGKAVKVPTHIYKKMLSAEKSQIRLAKAQQMAQVADQLAMQQDPRYQPSAEDQFLAEPDQQHEMKLMMAQQQADMDQQYQQSEQQYQSQKPSVGRRIVDRFGNIRKREQVYPSRFEQQQVYNPYDARNVSPLHRPNPTMTGIVREPQVTAVSRKADLLRTPRDFDRNIDDSMLTEHRNINFFSNRQPVVVPDRSKLAHFNKGRNGGVKR